MSDYFSYRARTLRTPVQRYAHPTTGRRITLIGTVHVASASYYAGLRDLIDALEASGAIVQCEGSSLLPLDHHDLTADERQVLVLQGQRRELELHRITQAGLVRQVDALHRDSSSWQIVDLDVVQVIRSAGCDRIRRIELRQLNRYQLPDDDPTAVGRFQRSMHRQFQLMRFMVWRLARQAAAQRQPSRGTAAVLLAQRNRNALDALFNTEQDVVLLWGCAHLPALAAGITAQGYLPTQPTRWHTAIVLPRPPASRPKRTPTDSTDTAVPGTIEHPETPQATVLR